MNKAKATGGYAKVRKLVTVLEKCNGKAAVGGKDALLSPAGVKILMVSGIVLLTGALFAIFFLTEPMLAPHIPIEAITKGLMLILLLMSFILSVKNIVTVLYTADDLPVLLPMPFSAGQIVTAKLAVASKFTVGLSVVLLNAVCLGLGIRAGLGAAFVIGTLLSSVMLPLTGIALATLVVVVVFRVFGFIRNRDITMVLGGIFTLVLLVAYMIVSNRFTAEKSGETALAAFRSVSSVSDGFPNISFMTDFMVNGNIRGLLIALAVTAAVVLPAMLAVKLFYFSTALSMQNTGKGAKAVSKDDLSSGKKAGAVSALTRYEAKHTRRNPAYLLYGFAMTFIWPVMVGVPLFFSTGSVLEKMIFPLDMKTAALGAMLFGVTASCLACGFNVLAGTAFSREGSTFSLLRALPVDFRDYYKSKRNFAMLICSLGSVGYVVLLGIVCLVTGVITLASGWVILYGAAVSFLLDLVFVNWLLLHNSKKPYFDWDSETEISRKLGWINIVAVIAGLIAFIAFMLTVVITSQAEFADTMRRSEVITTVTVVVLSAVMATALGLAFLINRYSVAKGAKNLDRLIE